MQSSKVMRLYMASNSLLFITGVSTALPTSCMHDFIHKHEMISSCAMQYVKQLLICRHADMCYYCQSEDASLWWSCTSLRSAQCCFVQEIRSNVAQRRGLQQKLQ